MSEEDGMDDYQDDYDDYQGDDNYDEINTDKTFEYEMLKPDEFVLGYKGTGFLDAGYVYAPYMPILPTDLLMDDTFTGRRGWASYVGKCKLNPQMYVRGRIVTNSKVA